MKANIKSLILGIFFLLLPRIYYHLVSQEGNMAPPLAMIFITAGAILIIYSFTKKDKYKLKDIKMGKVFEIKSVYDTPWESRIGISFENKEGRYNISPIPEELMKTACEEKYRKTKNGIIKIS